MRSQLTKYILAILVFALSVVGPAHAQTKWVATWATSPQLDSSDTVKASELGEGTLRQIVHLSLGGSQIRMHFSNRYGTEPMHFTAVHVARAVAAGSAKIAVGSDKKVLFSGKADVIVPEGTDYVSDPVDFAASPLSDLAITLRVASSTNKLTGHPGSRANSFLAKGNVVSAENLPEANKIAHWYFIAGVDVAAPVDAYAIVVLGDSITDGHGATTDGNDRWPDLFAKRLQENAGTRKTGIVNQGIGGNRLLLDGVGANALARFDHDVLGQAGVRYVIVLEGINDLGMLTHEGEVSDEDHQGEVRQIIGAYEQIIARAHTQGIKVIGGTLTPYVGSEFYHPNTKNEADRQAVNAWIRTHFDSVIDFDKVLRDRAHPDLMLPEFDSGDHLHPGSAGFAAMANAVPLTLFGN